MSDKTRVPLVLMVASLFVYAEGTAVSHEDHGGTWMVASLKGQLFVQLDKKKQFTQVSQGSEVRRGYLLKLGIGSRATLSCLDEVHVVPVGKSGVPPCSGHLVLQPSPESMLTLVRFRPGDRVLLSPRFSRVTAERPTFIWDKPLSNGPMWLKLETDDEQWSVKIGQGNKVNFPAAFPQLVSGKEYRWTLVAGPDDVPPAHDWVPFTLVDPLPASQIKSYVARVNKTKIPDISKRLLISRIYRHYDVVNESYRILKEGKGAASSSVAQQTLAELAALQRLAPLAEEHLKLGLRLAKQEHDRLSEAKIYSTWAWLLEAGDADRSVSFYSAARKLYLSLGDTSSASLMQSKVAELRND